jgi:hypothetical protein
MLPASVSASITSSPGPHTAAIVAKTDPRGQRDASGAALARARLFVGLTSQRAFAPSDRLEQCDEQACPISERSRRHDLPHSQRVTSDAFSHDDYSVREAAASANRYAFAPKHMRDQRFVFFFFSPLSAAFAIRKQNGQFQATRLWRQQFPKGATCAMSQPIKPAPAMT